MASTTPRSARVVNTPSSILVDTILYKVTSGTMTSNTMEEKGCAAEEQNCTKEVAARATQSEVKKASKLAAALKARLSGPASGSSARHEVLARRMRTAQRWRSDNSTFSALNLDSTALLAKVAQSNMHLSKMQPVSLPPPGQNAIDQKSIRRQESYATATTVAPISDGEESDAESEAGICTEEKQQTQSHIPSSQEETAPLIPEASVSATEGTAAAIAQADPFSTKEVAAAEVAEEHKQLKDNEMTLAVDLDFQRARALFLAFRCFGGEVPPHELDTLKATNPDPLLPEPAMHDVTRRSLQSTPKKCAAQDRVVKSPPGNSLPPPSERAYRRQLEGHGEMEEIRRTVQSLLNKVCPENVATITEKIAKSNVREVEQLEVIIELIFKKALAEPHYCETYADLVFNLKSVFPQFPSHDGGKPIAFRSSVLNICQNTFEEMMQSGPDPDGKEKTIQDPEEIELCRKRCKDRMRANMRFIGHLYLRKLLSAKVIGAVICELTCCNNIEKLPEVHAVECTCDLILSIGHTLEELPIGSASVRQVCGRLLELKGQRNPAGKYVYCKRIQFMIQDLLDTRAAGWAMKVFKSSAKTKEEIRLEQERDLKSRSSGQDPVQAELVIAGQRPGCLSEGLGA